MTENKKKFIQIKLLPNFDHAIEIEVLHSYAKLLHSNMVCPIDEIILSSENPQIENNTIDKISLRYNSKFRSTSFRIVDIQNEDNYTRYIAHPTEIIDKEVELYSLHNQNDTLLFSNKYFNILNEISKFPSDDDNEVDLKSIILYEVPSKFKGNQQELKFFTEFVTDLKSFAERALKDDAIVKIHFYNS